MGRATGLIGILIVLVTTQSIGQGLVTGADIRGTVRDASGVVMYDASVVATNVETGISRPARTDRDGRYTLTGLPPGSYRVSAAYMSFATQVRNDVALLLGQVVSLDFSLPPAAQELIVVLPTMPLLEVDRPVSRR